MSNPCGRYQTRYCNAVLIKPKPNWILVSETDQTIRLAQRNNYNCVMRDCESEDAFIADFAVALNCGQIKTGVYKKW